MIFNHGIQFSRFSPIGLQHGLRVADPLQSQPDMRGLWLRGEKGGEGEEIEEENEGNEG